MSSFIKSIDSSTSTSNSSIILGAIVNETLDRTNAIQVAIANEIVLRNQAVSTAITTMTALINTSISNTMSAYNTAANAISGSFTSFLNQANTFTMPMTFTSSISVTRILLTSPFGGTAYGTNSNAGSYSTSIGNGAGQNSGGIYSVSIGSNSSTVLGHYNTAVGSACLPGSTQPGTYNSGIGINAGSGLITGSNNTFLGANASTTLATCTKSTAIGHGSQITDNNQVVLGTPTETVIVPGSMTVLGSILLPTNYMLSYSSLPTFATNQVGYQGTITSTSTYVCLATGYLLTQTIPLLAGIFHVQFRFDFFSNNNTTSSGSFFYGLNQTNVIGATCFNKVNFANITSNAPQSCFNSCIIKSTGACTYNLFINMGSETLNPTSFSVNAIIVNVTRLA